MSEQDCQDFRAELSSDIYPIENRYISFSSYIGQRDLDTRQFPPAILAPYSNQQSAPVKRTPSPTPCLGKNNTGAE